MMMAVRAGMFPVGALWGFRDEKELRENGVKAVIDSPQEFLRLIDQVLVRLVLGLSVVVLADELLDLLYEIAVSHKNRSALVE
jgi:hypothetical protein